MIKLIRITTIPGSLRGLLKDQLRYMSDFYEVIAVSGKGEALDEVGQREKVRTHAIEMNRAISPTKDIKSLYNLINFFKKERPDIVHTHTPKAGFLGMMAAYITRVPVRMHTVAGMPLMEANGNKKKVLLFVEKLTYACATHVYPNSYGLEEYILKEKLTTPNKVKVIGKGSSNGIDLDFFDPDKTDINDYPQLQADLDKFAAPDKFNYIFVGRLVKDKGINELISAFVKVHEKFPASNLILIGDFERTLDPVSAETEELINKHDSIYFIGYQKDIRPFLKVSQAMVFPSYREGLPNVPMQAGAFNLPVICTNIVGCTDIIENGVNGIMVEPKSSAELYDAMIEIQTNKTLYSKLQANAREMIKARYARPYLFNEIRKEYESALSQHSL